VGVNEKNFLTATMPVVVDWGGGVFADCFTAGALLFVSTGNERPHLALQHH